MVTCCGTAVSWASDALPAVTCARVARLFGLASLPDTLADVADSLRAPGPTSSPVDRAANVPAEGSPHVVETATATAAVATFADGLALAAAHDGPAAVDSHDPVSGSPVRLYLDGDGVLSEPGGLVLTFGAGPAGRAASADPAPETVRRHLAPYVHLFESRETTRQWEAATPDPVARLGIDDAANLAAVLLGAPTTDGAVTADGRADADRVAAYARDRSLAPAAEVGGGASPLTAPGVGRTPPSRN